MTPLLRFIGISLIFCAFSGTTPYPQDEGPPNIVLIIGDDIGWNDFGCYGHPAIQTPNIDRLASRGMRFNRVFLTASSCSPSRCSIISGRYPHNNGAAELHTPLPASMVAFPSQLQKAGYYTLQAGKTHMGPHAMAGFDDAYGREDAGNGGEERWVRSLQERPRNKAFFAWFASFDAHRAWGADEFGEGHRQKDAVIPPWLADTEATRQDLVSYYNEISRLDYYVGEVVAELQKQGVLDNTLIILMSDNGMPFPRAKTRVYDSGMQTPFIAFWPAGISPPGAQCNSLISAVDIAPSILNLAGAEIPAAYQGRSFIQLFKQPEQPFRKFVYAEHNWHDYEAHERMIRSQEYLYVLNERPNKPNGGPADSQASPSQEALEQLRAAARLSAAQADIFVSPRAHEELFAVLTDSLQLCNLSSQPQYQAVLDYYRAELQYWRRITGDNTPVQLTGDGFDRRTGRLLKGIAAFNQVPRGEMPGVLSGGLNALGQPGF